MIILLGHAGKIINELNSLCSSHCYEETHKSPPECSIILHIRYGLNISVFLYKRLVITSQSCLLTDGSFSVKK